MGYKLTGAYIGTDKVRPSVQLITTAGIYHSSDLGLISISSDGSTWITIADKNLGATTVYHDGDTLSLSNCGGYYQRGNNYMFPFSGSVTTSSTRVDPTGYGPGTVNGYRSNSTYIAGQYGRANTFVGDLRGATTNTNAAKQGPCDTGYHIPMQTEREALVSAGTSISAWTSSDGTNIKNYLLMPYANKRWYDGAIYTQGSSGFYQTAVAGSKNYSLLFWFDGSNITARDSEYTTNSAPIRPFKNDSVQPDSTRTVIYQPS